MTQKRTAMKLLTTKAAMNVRMIEPMYPRVAKMRRCLNIHLSWVMGPTRKPVQQIEQIEPNE